MRASARGSKLEINVFGEEWMVEIKSISGIHKNNSKKQVEEEKNRKIRRKGSGE